MEDPWATPSPWGQAVEPTEDKTKKQADPWSNDQADAAPSWGGDWGDSAPAWEPAAEVNADDIASFQAPKWSPDAEASVPLETLAIATPSPEQSPLASPEQSPQLDVADPPSPELEGFGQPMDLPPIPSPELPPSPGDEEGFGGFSSAGAGWANEHDDGDKTPPMPSWNSPVVGEEDDESEGEGWGAAKPPVPAPVPEDQEWELAQERLRRQQERAPAEVVKVLREAWTQLAKENSQGQMPVDPKLDEDREKAIAKQDGNSRETIRSLATVPSDINTYPTVLSSTVTNQRFKESLARSSAKASSSFLARPVRRHPKAGQSLSSTWDNEWTVRSKLGEPEAAVEALPTDDAPVRPGWGFWGRKSSTTTPQVLTTSGGGLLEVKTEVASPTATMASGVMTPQNVDRPASIRSMSSRPASPAPVPPTVQPQSQPVEQATAPVAGPSAVSRFFGRLRKQRTPSLDPDAVKDLELSQDDFSFLSDVPSVPQPVERGIGDLLMMEQGRTEEMASLESMLSSKATPLPAPLAPPPRNGPSPQQFAGSPAFQSTPPSRALPKSDMDLLSDMAFTAPASQPSKPQSTDWDAFLSVPSAPSPPPAPLMQPKSRVPTPLSYPMMPTSAPSPVPSPTSVPGLLPKPALQSPIDSVASSSFSTIKPMASSMSTPLTPQPSSRPPPAIRAPIDDDFGDFGGFSSPKPASSSAAFDDFGDFEEFSSPPPPTPPTKSPLKHFSGPFASNTSSQPLTPTARPVNKHSPGLSIHAPTVDLLNNSSGRTGRWPAPASPVAPALDPPPSNSSQSFFKLPPPPGSTSRVPTPLSQGFDAFDGNFGLGISAEQSGMSMGLMQPTAAKKSAAAPRGNAAGPFDLI